MYVIVVYFWREPYEYNYDFRHIPQSLSAIVGNCHSIFLLNLMQSAIKLNVI
jgi:hypothetical protein